MFFTLYEANESELSNVSGNQTNFDLVDALSNYDAIRVYATDGSATGPAGGMFDRSVSSITQLYVSPLVPVKSIRERAFNTVITFASNYRRHWLQVKKVSDLVLAARDTSSNKGAIIMLIEGIRFRRP